MITLPLRRPFARLFWFSLIITVVLSLGPTTFSSQPVGAAPLTTITKDDAFAPGGDVNGNGLVDPGDTLRYTVDITNPGGTDMTGVQFTDTIDPNTTLVGGSVQVSPVAVVDSYTTQVDTALTVPTPGVLANDGVNGATISAFDATSTQGGTVSVNADGSFSYTPPLGFFSPPDDIFTYTLTNSLGSSTATVSITVIPPAPTANDDTYTATRNTLLDVPVGTGVLSNDTDLFGGTVTAFDATSTQGGTVSVNADGSFTYNPPLNFVSPPNDTFTYTVTNAGGNDTATVMITVNPPPPVAVDDTYNATENITLNVPAGTGVLANDTDLFGGTVTAFDATSTQGGTVNVNADGSFTYNPPLNFVSPPNDTFTYTVTNAGGNDTVTVTITVTDLPAANDDSYTATRNTQLNVPAGTGVLANDTGTGITITAFDATSMQGGTVSVNADGSFTYNPPLNFVSPPDDTFTYTLTNIAGSDTATVTITVNPPPPVAVDDTYNATEDTVLNVPAGTGVLANDTNLFGGTVTAFDKPTTRGGTVSVAADGSFTYTPPAGTISPPDDTFTYTVTNAGGSDVGTVTIIITDLPAANDDAYTVAVGTTLNVPAGTGVMANDTGTGATVTAFDATSTQGGTVSVNPDGSFSYTPLGAFTSPPNDTFTYTITNVAGSDTATVTITVIPPPMANDDTYIAAQDTLLTVPAGTGVLANDTDLFGGTVTAFDATSTQGGTVNVNADGSFTYNPPTGFISPPDDTFTYTVTNGAGSDTATVTITVIPPPEANNDTYSAHGNINISIPDGAGDLFANDVLNGATLSAFDATSTQGGTVVVNANGSFTYNPAPGFEGADTFTYTLDNTLTDTATVTINVSGMVWFIDSSAAAGGDGRFSAPFNSLTAFNSVNDGGANHPATNDRVFVYQRGATYTGGIVLLNNQQLIGQGENLSALLGVLPTGSPAMPTATTNPTLTNTSGTGIGITLASGNDVRGVNVNATTNAGIQGTGSAGGTFQNLAITNAGGAGISLIGNPSGTFTFASTVSITGATGTSFNVSGGNAAMTFSGTMTKASAGLLVSVAATTGGTITFQTGTLNATLGDGILLDNADGTVNFNGATALNGGNARLVIQNGSSGNVTFANGTITNPTGTNFTVNGSNPTVSYTGGMTKTSTGLLVDMTTVSGGTVTFVADGTLSATAGDGILLDNADGTVNFNGTTTLAGGNARVRIQNGSAGTVSFASGTITNPSGTNFTVNASNPSVTYTGGMTKTSAGLLIDMTTVSSGTVTFQTGTLSATSGDGILFDNADGTVNFNGTTTLTGGSARVRIQNGSAGTVSFANGTITNPTGTNFTVNGSNPTVTYSGGMTKTSAGLLIDFTTVSGGTVTFQSGTVSATAGDGILFDNADGTVNFNGTTTLNSGSARVRIQNGSSGTFNFSTGTITNPTGAAFTINASAAHGTFTGNISDNSELVLDVDDLQTGGTYTFNGGTLTSTGTGARVINSEGNVSVSALTLGSSGTPLTADALTLTTNTGTSTFTALNSFTTGAGNNAILATNGGTVNSTSGTVSAVGAEAVTISNTTLGMTLTSVSANGGTNGILLNTTTGSFTVAGTGGTCTLLDTSGCSGGRIRNMTGADNSGTTPGGTGVVMNNATNVSLTRMWIHDHSNYGIRGTSTTGFTLDNSVVGGQIGTAIASPFRDSSLRFENLLGTANITNSDISGGILRNIEIVNTANSLTLTVNNNRIHDTGRTPFTGGLEGDDGLMVENQSTANITATITNNTFSQHSGDHFNGSLTGSGTVSYVITGNFYSNTLTGGRTTLLGGGFFILGATFNGSLTYNISNNGSAAVPLTGNRQGGAIHVNKGSGTATFSGRIENNFIGNAAITGSGSSEAFGIIVGARGAGGSHTTLINNNQVRQYFDRGILTEAGEGSAALNATITNNTVSNFADAINSLHGIHSDNGILGTDANSVCLDIRNNSVATAGNEAGGGADIRVRKGSQGGLTVRLPGLGGTTAADAIALISLNNPTANTVNVTGSGFTGGAACAQPSVFNPFQAETLIVQADEAKPDESILKPFAAPAMSGETVNVTIGTLPAGETVTITFDVTVDTPLPAGVTQVCNQGTVSGNLGGTPFTEVTDDPATGAANDPTCTPVTAAPVMSASKTAADLNGGNAVPGDVIEYTITVSNSGNQDAGGTTLTDPPPANTSYVAGSTTLNGGGVADVGGAMPFASGGFINSSGALSGIVEAGQTATVVFRVTVNDPFPAGVTTVSNQGTVSGTGFATLLTDDPGQGGSSDPTVIQVIAGLTLGKSFLTDPIQIGDTSGLQFTITNPAGNPALTSLSFTDNLPAGLVYVSPVNPAQCGGTVTLVDADSLAFGGGSIGAGASCSIDVTVQSDGVAQGLLTNTTSALTGDGGISAAAATDTIFVGTPPTATPTDDPSAPTATPGGATPEPALAPTPPPTPLCVDHNFDVNSVVRGNMPDRYRLAVFCRVIVQNRDYVLWNGYYITDAGMIGHQGVLDLGVEQAVDVFSPTGPEDYEEGAVICLRGSGGTTLFLDSKESPRNAHIMTTFLVDDFPGYTCVMLYGPGTLVLVRTVLEQPASVNDGSIPLSDCLLTSQDIVNLRAAPGTEGELIGQVPYLARLVATGYLPGWYRVIYDGRQGYVSADFVTTTGSCAA